jgi:hypothetical protein
LYRDAQSEYGAIHKERLLRSLTATMIVAVSRTSIGLRAVR